MICRSCSIFILLVFSIFLAGAAPCLAQPDPPTPPTSSSIAGAAAAKAQDDDAVLRPAEPDFTLINLPTTLPLPVHKGDFHLTHRFNGNLEDGDFGDQLSNLFGLDEGAAISFEYRFGVMKHLEAIVARTNIDRNIQFSAKYDAIQQSADRPVGVSGIVSIAGANNFRERYEPALGLSISRTIEDRAAVYAVPVWDHNSAAITGVTRDTLYLGLGARVRIASSVYVVGEVSPRLAGFVIGDPEYAFSIEKRIGGHVFDLVFANSQGTSLGQIARGGNPSSLYLGFNLTRKFF